MTRKIFHAIWKLFKRILPGVFGASLAYLVVSGLITWKTLFLLLIALAVLFISAYYVYTTKGKILLVLLEPVLHGWHQRFHGRVLPYPSQAMSIAMSSYRGHLNLEALQAIQCDVFLEKFRDALHAVYPENNEYSISHLAEHGLFVFWRKFKGVRLPLVIMKAHFDAYESMVIHSTTYVLWLNIVKAVQLSQAIKSAVKERTSAGFQKEIHARVTWFI